MNKNMLAFLFMMCCFSIGIFILFSMFETNTSEEKLDETKIPAFEPKVLAHIGTFNKVEIEGHWYLVDYTTVKSIIHMASCPCHNKSESKHE